MSEPSPQGCQKLVTTIQGREYIKLKKKKKKTLYISGTIISLSDKKKAEVRLPFLWAHRTPRSAVSVGDRDKRGRATGSPRSVFVCLFDVSVWGYRWRFTRG